MDSYDDYGAYYEEDAGYHGGDLNISARSSSPPPPPPPPALDESTHNIRDVPVSAKSGHPSTSAGFEAIFPPKQPPVQKEKQVVRDGPFPFLKRGSRKEPTALNRNPNSAEKKVLSSPPSEENGKNTTARSTARSKVTNDNYWGLDEMEQPIKTNSRSSSFPQQETKSNVLRPSSTSFQIKPSKVYDDNAEDYEIGTEDYDPYEENESLEEIIKHTTANRMSSYQQDSDQDHENYEDHNDTNRYEKPHAVRINAPINSNSASSVSQSYQQKSHQQTQQSRALTPTNRLSRTSAAHINDQNNDENVGSAVRPVSTFRKEIRANTPSNRNKKPSVNNRNNGQSIEASQSMLEEKMLELQKEIEIYK
jgi:hypothetical protein